MPHENTNPGAEPPRLFAAVSLPDQLREELQHICRQAKETLRFQKWTHPDDLHITVKFLGETSAGRVDAVSEALRSSVSGFSEPFALKVKGMGVFGPPARPAILWAGLQGGLSPLTELQRKVEAAMTELGFEAESRAYRPHLTLARRYLGSGLFNRSELEAADKLLAEKELSWTVSSLTLYRSRLGRTPMYEALQQFPFP